MYMRFVLSAYLMKNMDNFGYTHFQKRRICDKKAAVLNERRLKLVRILLSLRFVEVLREAAQVVERKGKGEDRSFRGIVANGDRSAMGIDDGFA